MRHSLYANNSRVTPGGKKSLIKGYNTIPKQTAKSSLEDNVLNLRVSNLMEQYKDAPEVITSLKGEINVFLLNLTIARELNSNEQEKKLRKEFSTYLSKLEKEIRNNVK